jgi:hypothetical protein
LTLTSREGTATSQIIMLAMTAPKDKTCHQPPHMLRRGPVSGADRCLCPAEERGQMCSGLCEGGRILGVPNWLRAKANTQSRRKAAVSPAMAATMGIRTRPRSAWMDRP